MRIRGQLYTGNDSININTCIRPNTSTSSPTLMIPCSTRPVATVPRPFITNEKHKAAEMMEIIVFLPSNPMYVRKKNEDFENLAVLKIEIDILTREKKNLNIGQQCLKIRVRFQITPLCHVVIKSKVITNTTSFPF